eukprot:9480970-Pyramimonas_sp.AAC.1
MLLYICSCSSAALLLVQLARADSRGICSRGAAPAQRVTPGRAPNQRFSRPPPVGRCWLDLGRRCCSSSDACVPAACLK